MGSIRQLIKWPLANRFAVYKISAAYLLQVANLILVFFLSPSQYGELTLVIVFAQFFFVLSAGISNGAFINVGTREYGRSGGYHDVLIYRVSFILLSLMFLGGLFYLVGERVTDWTGIEGGIGYVPYLVLGYIFYDLAAQLLYPSSEYKRQARYECTLAAVFLVAFILFVRDVETFVFVYFIVGLIGMIFVFSVYQQLSLPKVISFKRELCFEVYSFSLWQILSVVSIYFMNAGFSYILVYYSYSTADIGVFSLAMKLFLGMNGIFSLALILIPKIVNSEKIYRYRTRMAYYMMVVSVLLGGIYAMLAGAAYLLLSIVGREEYLESVILMLFLAPSFIMMAYSNLFNTIFSNTKLYKKTQFVIAAQAAVMAVVAFWAVNGIGLYGLILSYTSAYLISAIVYFIMYQRNKNTIFEL